MKRIFLALTIAGSAALPALAQGMMAAPDAMTCADFTAMDHDAMMGAMQSLDAGMSADDQAASGAMLADECQDNPDMMLGDAMNMMDN